MKPVAALFVDPLGPYPSIPGVECWDEARDARRYSGPHPVVAHPPCATWSSLRHLTLQGEESARSGLLAVDIVRKYGGVLEQPRSSKLWTTTKLPSPKWGLASIGDETGGFSIEVEQVAWGHVARKRTWLYLVGVSRDLVRETIRTGGTPTHWASGGRSPSPRASGLPRYASDAVPPGIKVCSAEQRRRTPTAFAEWLVSLARSVERTP